MTSDAREIFPSASGDAMNEISKQEERALTTPDRIDVAAQLMQVIAANPTAGADNLKALLDGMERVSKWQAEQEFTAAFSRLKFPPFRKTAKGHNAKYAPFEDIQEVIEPILAAEGFTLTFSSGEANAKGEIPTYGLLSHIAGHSRQGVIYLPPDVTPTRSGSTTMNALQSVGSSTSYGMRYVAKLMLNLRFVGDDTDGNVGGYISAREMQALGDLMHEMGFTPEAEAKFLTTFGAKALSDLPKGAYVGALNLLEAKRRNMGAK
jgi:hypothetical protein